MLIVGYEEGGSVLWEAELLLMFCLSYETDGSGTKCDFLQNIECTQALNEEDKDLRFMCLKWSTLDEEYHGAVAGDKLNDKAELNVGEWL